MKLIFLVLIAIFISVTVVSAQTSPVGINYDQQAQQQTTIMTRLLSLNSVQADSISVINRDYYNRIGALRSEQLASSERGQKLQALEDSRQNRLYANLNIGQYNQFIEERVRIRAKIDSLNAVHHSH